MSVYEWLAQLAVGDRVVVEGRWQSSVEVIDKVTPTQVCIRSERFRRANGSKIGSDSWFSVILREATPELVASVEDTNERKRLTVEIAEATRLVGHTKLPTESLRVIRAALQPLVDERAPAAAPRENRA